MSDASNEPVEPMDSELRDAAVSGVRWLAIARVVSDGLQFVAAVALARLISPAEFGNAAVALIFVPLSVILTYEGFGSALVQRKEIDRAHLEAATLISGAAGVVLTIATFLLAPVIAGPLLSDEIAQLIQLISPVFLVASVGTVSRAKLSRRLDFRTIGLIETVGMVVGAFASVGFAMAGLNAEAIVLGGLVATALASALLILCARPARPRWHRHELASITRFGAPASAAGTLYVAITNVDYAVLAAYAAKGGSQKPILIGVSEGAGLSVLAATDPGTKAAIAGVIGLGLPNLNELGWRWRDSVIYLTHGIPKEPVFSTQAIVDRVAPTPLAAIHSTQDEFVPLAEAQRIVDSAKEPKRLWVIKAADHRFSDSLPEFDRQLLDAIDWVRSHVRE